MFERFDGELLGMGKYGHFSKDGKEFIIIRPDTPAPWVNYLTNKTYHVLITHVGGGYSFYISPKDSRITRWRYNALPWDRPGKYVYLRDNENGEYWSLSWQPVCKPPVFYQCRHGLGYTIIEQEYAHIRSTVCYFVPLEDELEVWHIRLINRGNKPRNLSIFSFVELCLGHALVDLINQPNDQHFNDVRFVQEDNAIYATKRYWVTYSGPTVKQANQAWNKWVYFSSSLPVIGFDGSRNKFIGPWRSESNPLAIEQGKCSNTMITAGDAVAALQNNISLAPKEELEFTIILGVVDKPHDRGLRTPVEPARKLAKPFIKKYADSLNIDKEFNQLRKYWDWYLSHAQVATPDPQMNLALNIWNQYQNKITFLFSRNASYYHGGLLFGRGYRDACQDALGPVMVEPDAVKQRILEMAQNQFKNGSVMHCYFPITGGGERTGHSDTPLWFPLAVTNYLKETGDFAILEQSVEYLDGGKGTILQHLLNNINYVLNDTTNRGLPKFGPGDWNDTLDYLGRQGKGESVWVAMCLALAIKETVQLLKYLESEKKLQSKGLMYQTRSIRSLRQKYEQAYFKLANTINRLCWDGNWYIRGTNDWGEIIGSKKCKEGKIFINTQTWAVISGIAPKNRAIKALDSVRKYLDTPKGPQLVAPAYTEVNPRIGLATRCVPGKKENGAVFNHPVTWAIYAECLLGRGDIAYEYYKKALPPAFQTSKKIKVKVKPLFPQSKISKLQSEIIYDPADEDIYEVEPYVYAEYVTSPEHPTFGQASHSWLTGTAAWMLRDGLDHILGVKPTYNGLLVDPCIPKHWKEYSVTRKYRDATYHITVKNPSGINCGVKEIWIDGKKIVSNLLPIFPKGESHYITVILG
ncbi:MAG: glycosyl transferase family 36 [bacterium]|nr:glycosyl transferase family 36 [bacterium]